MKIYTFELLSLLELITIFCVILTRNIFLEKSLAKGYVILN